MSIGFERECFLTASNISSRKISLFLSRLAKPTQAKWAGSWPSRAKLYKAGTSFRAVKSPVAPKITRIQDSGILVGRLPSIKGLEKEGIAINSSHRKFNLTI